MPSTARRTLGRAIGATVLLLMLPVFLTITAAVRILRGRAFARSENLGHLQFACSGDSRLERFLRRYYFDQLPMMVDVARGDMALPDPRFSLRSPHRAVAELCLDGLALADAQGSATGKMGKVLFYMAEGREDRLTHDEYIACWRFFILAKAPGPEDIPDEFGITPKMAGRACRLHSTFEAMWKTAQEVASRDYSLARSVTGCLNGRRAMADIRRQAKLRTRERGSCTNTRARGSRRTTSRSAGGGSSGDDPPGDSAEPPSRRQGHEPTNTSAAVS